MRARSAWNAALQLLGRRDFFSAELERRLLEAGFDNDDVAEALARCRAADLVDDERVASRFVELRATARGWGPRRLEMELLRRGAPRDVAARAALVGREVEEGALEVALERAERRMRAGWWRLPARRARMVSSLLNRGFEAEAVRAAVDRLAVIRENEHDAADDIAGDPPGLP